MTSGWNYYGLPNGPTTGVTDSRVGVWNWGWTGSPEHLPGLWSRTLNVYGPPTATYLPTPGGIGGADARNFFITPPRYGYGLYALGYRSASPRLATPSVSVQPGSPLSGGPSARCCRVEVRLPSADAELWVNGAKTAATGSERTFESPELADGRDFRYELVARWRRNGGEASESRTVVVAGGKSVVVDFTPAAR